MNLLEDFKGMNFIVRFWDIFRITAAVAIPWHAIDTFFSLAYQVIRNL